IDMVLNGAITLPAGDQVEPFVDVDDIADVAVAALTQDNHSGRIYEVTGPRLMTFADVANDLSRATGREISFIDVPHKSFITEMENSGAPEDVVWMLDYLFATVL
ncbi:NmrA family transcriptional regulator, partial [Pantoea sp. SIMBA_133]